MPTLELIAQIQSLKTELTALKALVREMGETVKDCANTPLAYRDDEIMMSYFYVCVFCEAETKDKNKIKHVDNCEVLKARENLSRLEVKKIMEETP